MLPSTSDIINFISVNSHLLLVLAILFVASAGAVLSVVRLYAYLTCGYCRNKVRMEGKVVIITGPTGGIGKETAREMAKRGARVILACRNKGSGEEVRAELIEETKNPNIIVKELDLSRMKSVRAFAADVNKSEPKLHVLVHNAGTAETKLKVTEDGIETTMATNHFGPFLLTHLLIDLLKRSGPNTRIVVVASELYRFASLNLNRLNPIDTYFPVYLYYVSKYANICFTRELARRLEGSGVTANCLHPGMIDSGIWRNTPWLLQWPMKMLTKTFFKTPQQGCQTTIHLVTSDELTKTTGLYFMDCKQKELNSGASDMAKAKKLWELSEKYVNLKPEEQRI